MNIFSIQLSTFLSKWGPYYNHLLYNSYYIINKWYGIVISSINNHFVKTCKPLFKIVHIINTLLVILYILVVPFNYPHYQLQSPLNKRHSLQSTIISTNLDCQGTQQQPFNHYHSVFSTSINTLIIPITIPTI